MGYYVRVLSTSADCVSLSALQSTIKEDKLRATLSADEGVADDWTQLILRHADGREIALIERNLVEEGSLGAGELAEFVDEIAECKPANAAKWLLDYFPGVRCIYAFQVLSGTYQKNGWEILGAVKNRLWSAAPSILQADNEGFSNEEGYHILWQFSDSVEGDWWMAVLHDGQWTVFGWTWGTATNASHSSEDKFLMMPNSRNEASNHRFVSSKPWRFPNSFFALAFSP